jgi:hypothetical protein
MVTVVGQRGIAWRALSGGGGDWLGARREVRSTGGAHGGVGGAVPWLEVPGDGGAPVDMAAASDTLPGSTALSTRRSRPVLEEGVAPDAQLDRALEARRHGSSTAAARSRGALGTAGRAEQRHRLFSGHCLVPGSSTPGHRPGR